MNAVITPSLILTVNEVSDSKRLDSCKSLPDKLNSILLHTPGGPSRDNHGEFRKKKSVFVSAFEESKEYICSR